jgi:hypothetical protein
MFIESGCIGDGIDLSVGSQVSCLEVNELSHKGLSGVVCYSQYQISTIASLGCNIGLERGFEDLSDAVSSRVKHYEVS